VTNYKLTLFVDSAGTVTEREKKVSNKYDVADPCHPMGRRPADFVDLASGGTAHGHLVRALHHEAESVRAFTRIARELEAHGAPEELVQAARKAARDERRHAALCGNLTNESPEIAHDDLPIRSLLDLAIDNAREGCVGETYAALANVMQSRDARTPELRAHFSSIAPDEIEHAALAYAIAEWIADQLDDEERQEVRKAVDVAVRDLARTCGAPSNDATRALGLPRGHVASMLFECVARAALVAA
jgi:rubrerythrin